MQDEFDRVLELHRSRGADPDLLEAAVHVNVTLQLALASLRGLLAAQSSQPGQEGAPTGAALLDTALAIYDRINAEAVARRAR
jgi:hypothetical protein